MNDNKNARPAGGTAGQAAENNAASKIPQDDYTTDAGPISRLLSHGRENAIPLRHLTAMTKLDGRTVRAMITAERLAGVPILSDNSTGYYRCIFRRRADLFRGYHGGETWTPPIKRQTGK